MIWAGFLIGFLGSWHCIAMCGPIALMLPGARGKNRLLVLALYHGGKTLAYMTLGGLFGLLPAFVHSFDIQAIVTLTAGLLMLLLALIPFLLGWVEKRGFLVFNRLFHFRGRLISALDKNAPESSFYIGYLNGFVPCGMVYIAALGAMSQSHFTGSILFMLFFGLGTLPVMSIFILLTGYFKTGLQKYARPLRTAAFIIAGVVMTWRGTTNLNREIPQAKIGETFLVCEVYHAE
jgi:uncharacterized protein